MVGLAVGDAVDVDVEEVQLAVGGPVGAVGADVDAGVAQPPVLATLGDRAGDEVDPQLARDVAGPGQRRPVEPLGVLAQDLAGAERGPLLGSTTSSAPRAAASRTRWSAVARFPSASAVEVSCTAAARTAFPPLIDQSVKILRMPPYTRLWRGGRPLKRWRYAGVYGPDLMCCFGDVHIGGLPQGFWAVWDRGERRLHERTRFRGGVVRVADGRVRVRDRGVAVDLAFDEDEVGAVEVVNPHGEQEIWTRKLAGLRFAGSVVVDGRERELVARGVVDDSAGYHARHTAWAWSAGVGTTADGRALGWNLVSGVHDGPANSERAVWVDGVPAEAPPVAFEDGLSYVRGVDGRWQLDCAIEAVREREDHVGPLRSSYRQPFGTFSGTLPGGIELAEGYGVMEHHDVRW